MGAAIRQEMTDSRHHLRYWLTRKNWDWLVGARVIGLVALGTLPQVPPNDVVDWSTPPGGAQEITT